MSEDPESSIWLENHWYDRRDITDQRMAELEAELKKYKSIAVELAAQANTWDALVASGLIQFGEDPDTRVYSVWGFDGWSHDEDLLTAIEKAKGK